MTFNTTGLLFLGSAVFIQSEIDFSDIVPLKDWIRHIVIHSWQHFKMERDDSSSSTDSEERLVNDMLSVTSDAIQTLFGKQLFLSLGATFSIFGNFRATFDHFWEQIWLGLLAQ